MRGFFDFPSLGNPTFRALAMAASDEEDSEFERFLQASLSSSSASNRSSRKTRLSGGGGAGGRGLLSLSNQWLEEEEDDDVGNDAHKWLKPSHREAPQAISEQGRGRGLKLEVAVPTSLGRGREVKEREGSDSVTYSCEFSKDSIEASSSQNDQSGHSSVLNQSVHSSGTEPTVAGADTLEEKADKEQFFAALEGDHSVDYSEMIRQMGDTGLSTLTMGSMAVKRPEPHANSDNGDDETARASELSESETDSKTDVSHEGGAPSIKELDHTSNPTSKTSHTQREVDETAPSIKKINEAKLPSPKPSVTLKSADALGESVRQEGEKDELTRSSKSELSSLLTSHNSLAEEGRGFTLSSIHSSRLTASGHLHTENSTRALVRDRVKQKSSPSLSQELVSLEEVKRPPVKSSPTGIRGEGVGEREEVCHRENGRDEAAHIPSLESKPLAPTSSRGTCISIGGDISREAEREGVSLPSPSHGRTSHSSPQANVTSAPPDKLQVVNVSSEKEAGRVPPSNSAPTSNIEIHPPTFEPHINTRRREVGRGNGGLLASVTAAQFREEEGGTRRDEREGEVVLREAGDELEKELSELQLALEAAGLPGIGADGVTSNGRQITREKLSLSSQTSSATDELEGTIRSLATEELTSITKEMLSLQVKSGPKSSDLLQTTSQPSKARVRGEREPARGFSNSRTGSATSSFTYKTRSAETRFGVGGRKTGLVDSRTSLASTKSGRPIDGLGNSSRGSRTGRGGGGRGRSGGMRWGKEGGRGEKRELEMLQNEVDSLKQALAEEKSAQEERDDKHREREAALKASHCQREQELKREIATLNHRLQEYELSQSLEQRVKVGGVISEGEREELKSGMEEQETIIRGYQKENERLYSQLSEMQNSLRAAREQLTQRLRTELANARAQLELQASSTSTGDKTTPTTTSKSDDIIRITQLEDQLERSQDKCRELERQVTQLKHSLHVSEKKTLALHPVERPREKKEMRDVGTQEMLVGSESTQLKEKEEEIAQLKERLAAVQKGAVVRRKKASKSGSAEAERIQQLERQVRGLNDIIKRRFPNSLSALIIAANSSGRGENPAVGKQGVKFSASGEVDGRMRELEAELRRREEGEVRKIRELEQKYSRMESHYEQQLSALREQLERHQQQHHKKIEEGGRDGGKGGAGEITDQIATLVKEKQQLLLQSQRTQREDTGAGGAKELARENTALRRQLSAVQLEAAQERVKLQSQLAEAEAAARAAREEATTVVSSLRRGHLDEVDSLKAQFARHHSNSETAALRTQLSALQVECHLLKEQLQTSESEREGLKDAKEREELLKQQIKQLSKQLVEAKRQYTPEMHHFSSLLAKITTLETRISDSECLMSQKMERLRQPITDQIKQVELKWQREVQAKNAEIAQFRSEMDQILHTLHALRQDHH